MEAEPEAEAEAGPEVEAVVGVEIEWETVPVAAPGVEVGAEVEAWVEVGAEVEA